LSATIIQPSTLADDTERLTWRAADYEWYFALFQARKLQKLGAVCRLDRSVNNWELGSIEMYGRHCIGVILNRYA